MSDGTTTENKFASEGAADSPTLSRSNFSRAVDETGVVCQTHIGGQALIEGIMMRGRYNWAVAVREPTGNLYLEEHDLISGRDKNSWMYKPLVRGCTALVESLALGYRALDIAAQHAFIEDQDDNEAEDTAKTAPAVEAGEESSPVVHHEESKIAQEADENPSAIPKSLMTVSMILGVLLGVGIFIVLPAIITNFVVGDYGERTLIWNLVDGVIRVAIFVFYLWLIGRMPDIRRMFSYHGAEHKTIHCYEHGLPLTVANARSFPTLHVRCGTAFMIMTMIIAILVFTLVPVNVLIDSLGIQNTVARLALVILSRIVLLPLVAGISYEVTVKWAGSRPENPVVQVILWPGLQLQRLTTNEPDDEMLQVAIMAIERVLLREEQEQVV